MEINSIFYVVTSPTTLLSVITHHQFIFMPWPKLIIHYYMLSRVPCARKNDLWTKRRLITIDNSICFWSEYVYTEASQHMHVHQYTVCWRTHCLRGSPTRNFSIMWKKTITHHIATHDEYIASRDGSCILQCPFCKLCTFGSVLTINCNMCIFIGPQTDMGQIKFPKGKIQ